MKNNKMNTIGLFVDFYKTFDKVNHKMLSHKLLALKIQGNIEIWIRSYSTNRTEITQVINYTLQSLDVPTGVPQGSFLGPN